MLCKFWSDEDFKTKRLEKYHDLLKWIFSGLWEDGFLYFGWTRENISWLTLWKLYCKEFQYLSQFGNFGSIAFQKLLRTRIHFDVWCWNTNMYIHLKYKHSPRPFKHLQFGHSYFLELLLLSIFRHSLKWRISKHPFFLKLMNTMDSFHYSLA